MKPQIDLDRATYQQRLATTQAALQRDEAPLVATLVAEARAYFGDARHPLPADLVAPMVLKCVAIGRLTVPPPEGRHP